MTLLTTREALAEALPDALDAALDAAPKDTMLAIADALLASGAVVDAATLADDEALVTAGWDASSGTVEDVRAIYRALAAALSEPERTEART